MAATVCLASVLLCLGYLIGSTSTQSESTTIESVQSTIHLSNETLTTVNFTTENISPENFTTENISPENVTRINAASNTSFEHLTFTTSALNLTDGTTSMMVDINNTTTWLVHNGTEIDNISATSQQTNNLTVTNSHNVTDVATVTPEGLTTVVAITTSDDVTHSINATFWDNSTLSLTTSNVTNTTFIENGTFTTPGTVPTTTPNNASVVTNTMSSVNVTDMASTISHDNRTQTDGTTESQTTTEMMNTTLPEHINDIITTPNSSVVEHSSTTVEVNTTFTTKTVTSEPSTSQSSVTPATSTMVTDVSNVTGLSNVTDVSNVTTPVTSAEIGSKKFSILLRITSIEWQEAYANNTSDAYQTLKDNMTAWLSGSFTNLTSYEGSKITSFSQGSVVANIESSFTDPGVTEQQVLDALRGAQEFPLWKIDNINVTVKEFLQSTSVSSTIHTPPNILSDITTTTTHVTTEESTGTQSVTTTSTLISHENSTEMTSSFGNVTQVNSTPPHNVTFDTSMSHENVTSSIDLTSTTALPENVTHGSTTTFHVNTTYLMNNTTGIVTGYTTGNVTSVTTAYFNNVTEFNSAHFESNITFVTESSTSSMTTTVPTIVPTMVATKTIPARGLKFFSIQLRITSLAWQSDYINNMSSAYVELKENITSWLNGSFTNLTSYEGSEITNFSQGSVVANIESSFSDPGVTEQQVLEALRGATDFPFWIVDKTNLTVQELEQVTSLISTLYTTATILSEMTTMTTHPMTEATTGTLSNMTATTMTATTVNRHDNSTEMTSSNGNVNVTQVPTTPPHNVTFDTSMSAENVTSSMNLTSTTALPENVTHGSTTNFYVNTTDLMNMTTGIVTDYTTVVTPENVTHPTTTPTYLNVSDFSTKSTENSTSSFETNSTTTLLSTTPVTKPTRDLKMFAIKLRITSLDWQDDYSNNISTGYIILKYNITTWLNESFANFTSYEGSDLRSFSQGSVVASIESRFSDPGVTEQQVMDALREAQDFPFWIVDKTNLTVQELKQFTSISSTLYTTATEMTTMITHLTTQETTRTQPIATTPTLISHENSTEMTSSSTMINHDNSTEMTSSYGNDNVTQVTTTHPHNVTFDTSMSHENVTSSIDLTSTTALPENVTHGSTTNFYVNTTDLMNMTTGNVTDYTTGNVTDYTTVVTPENVTHPTTTPTYLNVSDFSTTSTENSTSSFETNSTTTLLSTTPVTTPTRDLKMFAIKLRITSLDWQNDYNNNMSTAYITLKDNITTWLNDTFSNFTSYEGSDLTSFSRGSVVANIESSFSDPSVTEQQVLDALRGAQEFPFGIIDNGNVTVQEFLQSMSVSSTIQTTPTIFTNTTTTTKHVTTEDSTGTQSATTTSTLISHENSTDTTSSYGNVNVTQVPTTPPHNVTFDTSMSHENVTSMMNLTSTTALPENVTYGSTTTFYVNTTDLMNNTTGIVTDYTTMSTENVTMVMNTTYAENVTMVMNTTYAENATTPHTPSYDNVTEYNSTAFASNTTESTPHFMTTTPTLVSTTQSGPKIFLIELRITGINWTDEYNTNTSDSFLTLRDNFTSWLQLALQNFSSYEGSNITELRPGSVIVVFTSSFSDPLVTKEEVLNALKSAPEFTLGTVDDSRISVEDSSSVTTPVSVTTPLSATTTVSVTTSTATSEPTTKSTTTATITTEAVFNETPTTQTVHNYTTSPMSNGTVPSPSAWSTTNETQSTTSWTDSTANTTHTQLVTTTGPTSNATEELLNTTEIYTNTTTGHVTESTVNVTDSTINSTHFYTTPLPENVTETTMNVTESTVNATGSTVNVTETTVNSTDFYTTPLPENVTETTMNVTESTVNATGSTVNVTETTVNSTYFYTTPLPENVTETTMNVTESTVNVTESTVNVTESRFSSTDVSTSPFQENVTQSTNNLTASSINTTEPTRDTSVTTAVVIISTTSPTVTIQGQIVITNGTEWNDNLSDLKSTAAIQLKEDLVKELTDLYQTIPGFQKVDIISFSKGSVKVLYQVVFNNSTITAEHVEETLKKHLMASNSTLGFYTIDSTQIKHEEVKGDKKTDSEEKFPDWAIAVIVCGGCLLIFVLFLIIILCCRRTTNKKYTIKDDPEDFQYRRSWASQDTSSVPSQKDDIYDNAGMDHYKQPHRVQDGRGIALEDSNPSSNNSGNVYHNAKIGQVNYAYSDPVYNGYETVNLNGHSSDAGQHANGESTKSIVYKDQDTTTFYDICSEAWETRL